MVETYDYYIHIASRRAIGCIFDNDNDNSSTLLQTCERTRPVGASIPASVVNQLTARVGVLGDDDKPSVLLQTCERTRHNGGFKL